jgi:hypothetical protein
MTNRFVKEIVILLMWSKFYPDMFRQVVAIW